MSESDQNRHKVLHRAEDLIALEDEITLIANEIRSIRQDLAKYGMEGVELKSGTFRMHLSKLRTCVPALKSDLQKQAIQKSVKDTRDRIKGKSKK